MGPQGEWEQVPRAARFMGTGGWKLVVGEARECPDQPEWGARRGGCGWRRSEEQQRLGFSGSRAGGGARCVPALPLTQAVRRETGQQRVASASLAWDLSSWGGEVSERYLFYYGGAGD